MLEHGHLSLVFVFSNNYPRASFDVWHARLGHVSHSTISLLNKICHLSVTSLLPNPFVFSSYQLAKTHRLPFQQNEKCAYNV